MGDQKKKHRVVIAGYYGFGNLGDEALLHVVLRWLETFPDVEPCVLSGDRQQTRRHFGVKTANRIRLSSIIYAMWGAKALIFGGGGLLQDTTSRRSLVYYLSLIRLANLMKVPVMMLGQGLGPLTQRGQQRVADALKQVSYISVRDEQSFRMLSQWGLPDARQGVDLVLSVKTPKRTDEDAQAKPLLGLALVSPPETQMDKVLFQIAEAITKVQKQHDLIPIFLASSKQDLSFGIALNKRVPAMTVLPLSQDTPEKHLQMFSGISVLWGSRLHSLIMASMMGVPFIGLGYDPKVKRFVDQLNTHLVQDMEHWPLNSFETRSLVDSTGMLLKGFHNFGDQLRQATKQMRKEARASLNDAKRHLEGLLGLHEDEKIHKVKPADARGDK